MREQQLHSADAVRPFAREEERRDLVPHPGLWVSTLVKKALDNVGMAVLGRQMDWTAAILAKLAAA